MGEGTGESAAGGDPLHPAGGRGRPAREVRQALYPQRVCVSDGRRGTFEVTCLVAREIGAPPGVKPIEWQLLSNRTAETLGAVVELIDGYRARWEIERLFFGAQGGLPRRGAATGHAGTHRTRLGAVPGGGLRIAHLMRLGRTLPDLAAALLLEPEEWQAAYILAKKPLPKQPPRLNEVLRPIARLGGFRGRKADREPGVKAIWLGLQRIVDFAAGIKFTREAHRL